MKNTLVHHHCLGKSIMCAVIIMMNAIMNPLSVLLYKVSMMLEKALESLYLSTAVESVGIRLVL